MREEEIARERMDLLFEEAKEAAPEDQDLADRYVSLARRIGMSYNISLPKEFSRRICSECGSFLVPGENCRVRLDSDGSKKVVTCGSCGNVERFPYED
ncbi:MAG: ribonuclease P [Candidatus Nanohaloarchaeota archaeon QJJ-9]|nr:ribonuclease P [Candidatus Nanohaloarchaeota archaeon QJJ-9]